MSLILISTPLQGRSAIAKDDTEGDTGDRRKHKGSFCLPRHDSRPFAQAQKLICFPTRPPRDKLMFHRLHQLLSSYQCVRRRHIYTAAALDGSFVDVNGSKRPFT